MKMKTLQDLFQEELRDLFSAENQLVKALPKMAKAATTDELREGFQEHLEQTKGHVERLEMIAKEMDFSLKGKKCTGMEGLIEEGKELIDEDAEAEVLDAGLIAAAQKVEHYEMAGYGCVRTWAEQLGLSNAARLLEETYEEEKATDEKLSQLAESMVNMQAQNHERSNSAASPNGNRKGRAGAGSRR
jgi:ferritin-like metal-binding protein YciE